MPRRWGVIAELAASDEDVRVRRAAVERIGAVGYLARIARTERDESLRRELADRLVAIANAPADDRRRRRARRSTGSSDQKQLRRRSPSRRRTTRCGPRRSARFTTRRCSASVARHAVDPQIALEAVDARDGSRPSSSPSRRKTDHKDAGITALERAAESAASDVERRELLDGVAARAKNKSVAKRARVLLQEIDEAEAARRAAHEEWQKRVGLVHGATRRDRGRAGHDRTPIASSTRLPSEWRALAAKRTTRSRPETLVATTTSSRRSWRARGPRSRSAGARKPSGWPKSSAPPRAARRSSRICERVEALRGEDTPRRSSRRRAPSGRACPARPRRSATMPSCARASTSRAGAPSSVTRTVRPSRRCTPGSASCRSRPTGCRRPTTTRPRRAEREAAWRAVADEWQSLAGQADGLDEAVAATVRRGRGPRPAARGREARRRRAHAQAAGAARRAAGRARHGARGRRGSDAARGRPRGARSEDRRWTRRRR